MPSSVRVTSPALVGRGEELRSTLAALRDLRDDRPGVVTVSGPAGIGKTRFATALADELRAGGALVMAGACLDLGAGAPPYSPLIAAFRSVDPPAVQVLDALTGAVQMRRSRLFELLRHTMAALARRRLTVLVVEDLQWLDRTTRDALLYLASMVRGGRWALVVTYREDEPAARPAGREALEFLQRDALVRVILDALSPSDVAAQMAAITGAPVSPGHGELMHRRTGGIPLLVEEVVAAEAAGTGSVPDHLRDLFLARVKRLGAPAVRAVEAVAVVGDRCGDRLIAEVLGADRTTVAAALDRAAAADVLVPDRRGYRMRHELLREAVYHALPAARRRRLHAKTAAALAAVPHPDAAAMAHHWYLADEPAQSALANLEAAALAERIHAPGEAHIHLERVLEHFDALPAGRASAAGGRGTLLARAAEAAYLGGDFVRAVAVAKESLREVAEPWVLAMRWERLARYCWVSRDGAGAHHAWQQSVAMLTDDAPAYARARVLSGYGWHLAMAGRRDDAQALSQQALEAAEACGDPLERCRALLAWGYARGDEERGLHALREARELAAVCDAGDELARAHLGLGLSLQQLGHTAEREQVLRDGLRYVATYGMSKSYAAAMHYLLAELLLDVGRWAEAEELLQDSVAHGVHGVPAMFTYAYLARLAAARGGAEGVRSSADRVAALSQDLPQQPLPLAIALSARAESCLWSGRVEQAVGYAERAEAIATYRLVRAEATATRVRALADAAEEARRRGQAVAESSTTDEQDAKEALGDGHPQVRAFAATVLAELSRRAGRRDPAPWRDAVEAWGAAADPYRAAYCRWRLAHALLATRAGRREAARELRAAQLVAIQLAAQPLRAAIEQLALAARIHLGADVASGEAASLVVASDLGLTHRELEILPLLAAGRTNAEIAQTLVVSPRTVGVHVSRILQKLGASRRTEAADMARRRGLVR